MSRYYSIEKNFNWEEGSIKEIEKLDAVRMISQ